MCLGSAAFMPVEWHAGWRTQLPNEPLPCILSRFQNGARSSAVEHFLDMEGVTGSIPVAPTNKPAIGAARDLVRLRQRRI